MSKNISLLFEDSELEILQMAADMYTKGNIKPLIKSLITAGYDHLEDMDNYLPAEYKNKDRPSSIFYAESGTISPGPMTRREKRELARSKRRGKQ